MLANGEAVKMIVAQGAIFDFGQSCTVRHRLE
jgi:hypothetical protein